MSIRDLRVVSIDGHDLATNYRVYISESVPATGEADINYVPSFQSWPKQAGKTLKERTLPMTINILETGAGTIDELLSWFDPSIIDEIPLVAEDGDGTEWYLMVTTKKVPTVTDKMMITEVEVGDPIWKTVTPVTEAWNVASSPTSHTVTNDGPADAYPVFYISPGGAKVGGYGYGRFVVTYNQTNEMAVSYSVNVVKTSGSETFNHASLVSGGKAQADGDDFRVLLNGKQIYRYVGGGGWNSSTLKVFCNLAYQPKLTLTLGTAIASSGDVDEIAFEVNESNYLALKRLQGMRRTKLLMIGGEIYSYLTVEPNLLKVTGTKRQQRWTSMASHSVGDTVRYLEHDLIVIYGNTSVSAPAVTDNFTNNTPMIDVTNSTRLSHVYTNYVEFNNPRRPMSWILRVLTSAGNKHDGETNRYTASENTDVTSGAASVMGMRISAYDYLGWKTEQASLEARLVNPFGAITDVQSSGKTYKYLTSFPTTAALQKLVEAVWVSVWNQSAPGSSATWTPFGPTSSSLGGSYSQIRFFFSGKVAGAANNIACMEVDPVTVTLDSSLVPVVEMGAENSEYYADIAIDNLTTDETIYVERVMAIGETLMIDCLNKDCVYDENQDSFDALRFEPDTRRVWMHLANGDNTIRIRETGVTDLDVTVEFERRML